ncbi:MAG: tetratricopeptide repeat protein [Candidatus Latescibacteria bacterium]|nr:tetratricopeptide repeat protein [Candidatus Latescibacterota bacterium]
MLASTPSLRISIFCLAILLTGRAGLIEAQEAAGDRFQLARNLYTDARDYATAADLLAEFIRDYPRNQHVPEARLLLADAYKNSQRCDLAVVAYEDFYREHSDHLNVPQARRSRAHCLAATNRYLEAAQAFEEVQRLYSASQFAPPALLEAAANYTRLSDLQQAQRVYHQLIAAYQERPQVHAARYRLALLLFVQGQAEKAQDLLGAIALSNPAPPQTPAALLLDGRIDLFLGRLNRAQDRYRQLHQRFPRTDYSDSAYIEIADHLFKRHQFSQAGDAYQTAFERLGDTPLKNSALLGLADARRLSGHTQAAIGHYRNLRQRLGQDHIHGPRAHLGLAIALGQTEQFTAAVRLFHELAQAAPATPEAVAGYRQLGLLYQRRGDYTRAITWYRHYLQAEAPGAPDRARVELDLAQVYAQTGYREEAIDLYRNLATAQLPLSGAAQFGLARTLEQAHQPRRALREYMVLLEQFPGHQQEQPARQRLEYLRQFTVLEPEDLARRLRQIQIDELSGSPRQRMLLDLAQTLYDFHDFPNAVRVFENYAASYPEQAQAHYYLAESLLQLARQYQLENRPAEADSLHQLGLQEHRILARTAASQWAQKAELRLLLVPALPDSGGYEQLVERLDAFLAKYPDSPHREAALLHLAQTQHQQGRLDQALLSYQRLQKNHPNSHLADQVLFGLGTCQALRGEFETARGAFEQIFRDYPASPLAPQVLFELGRLLLQQNQLRPAAARYEELLLAYPAFPRRRAVQTELAATYHRLEDFPAAIHLYRQMLAGGQSETAAQIHLRLAEAYHRSGQFEAALDQYRQARPQTIALDSLYFNEAVVLVALERGEEAVRQFRQLQDEFPDSPLSLPATEQAAHLLFDLERYKEAYQLYQPLLKNTTQAPVYGRAVLALFGQGRLEEARKDAKNFAKRFPKDDSWPPRFRLEEGRHYLDGNQFKKALEIFAKLEKKKGDWADDGAYYAAVALWGQNRHSPSQEGAARALQAQIRFVEQYSDSPYAPQIHLTLGNYYYQLQNFLMAAGSYKRVLADSRLTPVQASQEAIWKLLNCYARANELDEAHRTAERLLRDFPDHPRAADTRLEIGALLKEKGQYVQAISHLEKVLEWATGDNASEARLYIGESYQNMGEYRKAIEAYYRVSFHGEGFSAWITSADYKRAQCYEALGELPTAISVYERIVQREGGNSDFAAYATERINALRQRL